jgi:glycerol-3-phosphate dehydrogenase (NAD(P)+)
VVWGRDADALGALARTRTSPHLPGVALASAACRSTAIISALAAADADSARRSRAGDARGGDAARRAAGAAAADRLRQGDRARLAALHDRGRRRGGAGLAGGDPLRAELRRRRRRRPADRGDAGERRRGAGARAGGGAVSGPNLRLYHSTDPRGVEIGGAAKNVLAIACGVTAGLGLGASAGAALIARGFAELRRFAAAFGARPTTLMGLSGLGDLVLTCSTRNHAILLSDRRWGAAPASPRRAPASWSKAR